MRNKVSLIKCSSYNKDEVFTAAKKAVDLLGGMSSFVKPGQKVLLKINMLRSALPEEGVTTHPSILKAVISLVKEAGGKPFVGDSPGFDDAQKAAEFCGYKKLCADEGVPFIPLKTEVEIKNPSAVRFKSFIVAKEALDADVIINLPKMKTHNLTGITGAVKNMFGCVPGLIKSKYHMKIPDRDNFSLMLLDLFSLLKPRLSIMDAILAMEGEGGPSFGPLRNTNFIAASENAIALDEVLCKIVNIDPSTIPTLRIEREQAEIVGERLEDVKCKDFKSIPIMSSKVLPGLLHSLSLFLLIEKPRLIKEKCVSCQICRKVCQSQAIGFQGKHPVFDYNKCIRCFCCAEMCPERAIQVKRGFSQNFLYGIYVEAASLCAKLILMLFKGFFNFREKP